MLSKILNTLHMTGEYNYSKSALTNGRSGLVNCKWKVVHETECRKP